MRRCCFVLAFVCGFLRAQEAESGFELRATMTGAAMYSHRLAEAPRRGDPLTAGFRSVLYPTWKLSRNWVVAGAVQAHSRPYFFEQFSTQGHGVKADILQGHLTYSRFGKDKSIAIRMGLLSSAFGSYLLRYDDAVNPLIDMPMTYGYYYKSVTTLGLAGVQMDATFHRLDARAQFVNSSPANRRSVFDTDQYGNWAGGVGYTILQGFRVGMSAYRGPYLHRQYPFYRRGEAAPRELPATAIGIDADWARGHWNGAGEMQWFNRDYRATKVFTQDAGYMEVRRVLHPRWYVAERADYIRSSVPAGVTRSFETAIGFRPNRHQLIKAGYQILQHPRSRGSLSNALAIQIVTTVGPFSVAR